MPVLRLLSHCFWFASVPCQAILLVMMVRRGLHREFPIFAIYTGWGVLRTSTLLAINYMPLFSGDDYYRAFVASGIGDTALGFCVIYEIFNYLRSGCPAASELGARLFRGATIVLLLISIALAWYAPANGTGHTMSVYYVLQRTVSILQCGLVVLLFLFSRSLGLSWRNYAFGIALGFGVYASVTLGTAAIRSQIEGTTTKLSTNVLTLITTGRSLLCILIWMAYLLAQERRPPAPIRPLPQHDLERWNRELQRLLRP